MIRFAKANTKLKKLEKKTGKRVYSFNLSAGQTCPFAKECQSKAIKTKQGMRIKDGKHCKFRCYAASREVLFKNVYLAHKKNSKIVKFPKNKIIELLLKKIPRKANIIRIHTSGDFANQKYFDAWLEVAKQRPDLTFYTYTKSLLYWIRRIGKIPSNLILTASQGGRSDNLIEKYRLRKAVVVSSPAEAKSLRLSIEEDESIVSDKKRKRKNVALLLHGTQPKGSANGKAVYKMRKAK